MQSLTHGVYKLFLFRISGAVRNDGKRAFQRNICRQKRRELTGELTDIDFALFPDRPVISGKSGFAAETDRRELTAAEQEERARLRKEYVAEFRKAFVQQMDNTYIEYPDGSRVKLSDRRGGK
jgi:uncharacterized protein YnzC (UPF0291/DUF896 family)